MKLNRFAPVALLCAAVSACGASKNYAPVVYGTTPEGETVVYEARRVDALRFWPRRRRRSSSLLHAPQRPQPRPSTPLMRRPPPPRRRKRLSDMCAFCRGTPSTPSRAGTR